MPVLGVPDIVVLKPVDIRLEPPAVVEVDIGDEQTCVVPSETLPLEKSEPAVFYLGHRSPPAQRTN